MATIAQTTRQANWFNTKAYPFKSHYLTVNGKQMHYIDEGKGKETILMIHGTPTWSFLYRHFIKYFSKNYRCIAPDHIGFGLSEKSEEVTTQAPELGHNLANFIEQLDLQNVTLIVHDFGGPIGLYAAFQHSDRIKRIVVMNTWCWATRDNPAAQQVDKILNSWLGQLLYLRFNFSPKVLLKKGFHQPKNLDKNTHQHYTKVFPSKGARYGLLKIGQSLVGASDWFAQSWEQLNVLETKPMLFLWGKHDTFITMDYLKQWQVRFPKAQTKILEAGHFVQEEAAPEAIQSIEAFLKQ